MGKKSKSKSPWHDVLASLAEAQAVVFPDPLPGVQLATASREPPTGEPWLHEIKLDGYRMRLAREGRRIRLVSRNNQDWSDRFPDLIQAARQLPSQLALCDGEVAVVAADGTTSFQALQDVAQRGGQGALYFVFDLLYLDGFDLRQVPLQTRKQVLHSWLSAADTDEIRYCDHIDGRGPDVFQQARQLGVEGIVSKRRDRPYRSRRTPEWIKVKCFQRDEFIIVGFTPPQASRQGFGALVLGYYDAQGVLQYAGRAGSGFSQNTLLDLRRRFEGMLMWEPQLPAHPDHRDVRWIRPELVAQIEYLGRSADGKLRHPTFQGLREDLEASNVSWSGTEQLMAPSRSAAVNLPEHLRFTHPDRLLYPQTGITKLGLAGYYLEVFEWMLPHLAQRLLSLVRAPRGVGATTFFQKHAGVGLPEAIHRLEMIKDDEKVVNLFVDDVEGLLSLVQFSAVELHVGGSRIDRLDRPDQMWFDLDPDERVAWDQVVAAGVELRDLLAELDLRSWVKTSGGKGLHLVVPLQRRYAWHEVRDYSSAVAEVLVERAPQHYTTNPVKAARAGKIYLDVLRNVRGATTVAAYSTRNRAGASVSVPVAWEELASLRGGDHFTVSMMLQRRHALPADPWADLAGGGQRLKHR